MMTVHVRRLVEDKRSRFTADLVREGKRPAVKIRQEVGFLYLDKGQDRKTLLKLVRELTALLAQCEKPNAKPKPKPKPNVCVDPGHCHDCGKVFWDGDDATHNCAQANPDA